MPPVSGESVKRVGRRFGESAGDSTAEFTDSSERLYRGHMDYI